MQKEKRELFGRIVLQSKLLFRDLVSGKMDDISHLWENENWIEAEGLLALLKVYESPGVYVAFRELMGLYHKKGQAGVTPGLSPGEQIADLVHLESSMEEEMRIELHDTVKPFQFLKKKRFRFAPHPDLHSQLNNEQSNHDN